MSGVGGPAHHLALRMRRPLLLVNPDLLIGDLLRNTTTSQTFRLYSAPDVRVDSTPNGIRVHVEGLC